MHNKDKFRELLENFVRTERVSPALLELLEERLDEAIGHEIDAELVRHCPLLFVRSSRLRSSARSATADRSSHSRHPQKFTGFTDSESSSPTPSQPLLHGTMHSSSMVQHQIQRIPDQLVEHSNSLRAFRADVLEESKHLVQSLWQIGPERDRRKGKKASSSGTFHAQSHLNGFNGLLDILSPHFLPPMQFAGGNERKNDDDEKGDEEGEGEEDEGHSAVVELSSLSLDHSMQEWPDEEMQNIVWLICSDGMEQSVRLTNVQKLHFVSPIAFSKSKAFEIFLGHLYAILPLPLLFNETMHVLAQILNCHDQLIWLKSVNCLSRVAHGVMRSPTLGTTDKKAFADFFRQILCYGPQIWHNFEQPIIGQIVQDIVEMLTVEISAGGAGGPSPEGFLALLAKVDPEAQWLLPWLHRRSILKLMMPKFLEMINEILDHHGRDHSDGADNGQPRNCPLFWAFEASVLFRCLQRSPVFGFLSETVPDRAELRHSFCRAILHFLTLAFVPPSVADGPRLKGFGLARRIVVQGLLETTTTDCGAAVLASIELFLAPLFALSSSVGAPLLAKVPSSSPQIFDLCLKVLLNVLLYADTPSLWPSVDVSSPFLTKVEQSLRHHLTLFIHHNDNPFSNGTIVRLFTALSVHCPSSDGLRFAFSDLSRTLLVPHLARLDLSDQSHRRLLVAIAYFTFMDNNSSSTFQRGHWRKSVGKMLNRVATLRNHHLLSVGAFSPANPHDDWAIFPSTIELSESEKHLAANALLQFLGFRQRVEKMSERPTHLHQPKRKSAQNSATIGPKNHEIGRSAHHSACGPMAFDHCEMDTTSKASSLSADEGDDCSHFDDDAFRRVHCLDFLASAPTDLRPANCEPLPRFVFFLVTQSELLVELLRSGQFSLFLQKQFTSFERLKDNGTEQQMNEFIGKMDFLITNLDVLTDLRHFVPNLGARLVELLHKYCSDSSGNLLMCALSRTLCLFLSHAVVASPAERRFRTFDKIGHIRAALANIPKSLYRRGERRKISKEEKDDKEEEEEEEGGEEVKEEQMIRKEIDQLTDQLTVSDSQEWGGSSTKEEPERNGALLGSLAAQQQHQPNVFGSAAAELSATAPLPRHCSIASMALEETDAQFWFAVLPENDTVATRHALIRTLFSDAVADDAGKTHKRRANSRPFELLHKFATKFWPMPEQKRMTVKPPQHSEWLSVLADYAHGLVLMPGSRATVRKRMGALRLLQQNGQSANDWFLAALFLSSGLSSEATADFCERLLERRHCFDSVWPVCCSISASSPPRSFPELLALRVFPRALSLLRHCPAFRPLLAFLSSCRLPSLFHLLLFYTGQAYLGILPFRAVQEYLVVAVLGGPDFQALHFCAVLAHIFHRSSRHHSLHFSSKFTSLFLRPIFLADFRFAKYALLKMDEH